MINRRWRLPRRGRTLILGLVAGFLMNSCSAQPTAGWRPTSLPRQAGCAVATAANSLCIVVLGDSIGVGAPLSGDDRWWVRLRGLLEASLPGRTIAIDNWAVSGSQVDFLESAARDQPEIGTYDLAIVIEGVNDTYHTPAVAWRPRYEAAISMLEAKGLMVVVTAPPPLLDDGAFGTQFDATAAIVRAVAGAHRPLLDIAARWRADGPVLAGTYYADAIHQGPAGQRLMATMARDVVLETITPVASR